MVDICKTALLPYTAQQMYELVNDTNSYPDFIPWCSGAKMQVIGAHERHCTLEATFSGYQYYWTTRNMVYPYHKITMTLLSGLFSELEGAWCFHALEGGSEVSLTLSFALPGIAQPVALVVPGILDSMLDIFCQRAGVLWP